MRYQKKWAILSGLILIALGVIGFISNPILELFTVNSNQNILHLITGLFLFYVGLKKQPIKTNRIFGIIYILLGIFGFFGILSVLAVNTPTNWLHIILGVISTGVGYWEK